MRETVGKMVAPHSNTRQAYATHPLSPWHGVAVKCWSGERVKERKPMSEGSPRQLCENHSCDVTKDWLEAVLDLRLASFSLSADSFIMEK